MGSKMDGALGRGDRWFFDPDDLVIVGLDTKDGKEHPLYDERATLEVPRWLIDSIKAFGVVEDVVIRRDGSDSLVVDGRQRTKAARLANKELKKEGKDIVRVPVTIRKDDDKGVEAIAALTNEQRQADTPLVRAQKAQRMLERGHAEAAVAMYFGITKEYLRQLIKLLDLDGSVQKAVENGEVSASAASKLASLKREEQKAKLAELREKKAANGGNGKVTAKDTKKAANPDAIVAPSRAKLRKVHDALPNCIERDVIAWVLGDIEADTLSAGTLHHAIMKLESKED